MRLLLIMGWIALMLVASSPGQAQEAPETIRWDRAPISLSLPVGKERYIVFPGRVQPGIPPELTTKLRVQAVNDTIYLLASEPFETTRLPVRDLDQGQFFLFDLKTDDSVGATPLHVVAADGRDEAAPTASADQPTSDKGGFGYVKLTRFAAQQIYAPTRLAQQSPGISTVPLPEAGKRVAGFFRGGEVDSRPIAGWRSRDGLFVTAVNVTNLSDKVLELDPRLARGDWLAATFQHQDLGPKGQPSDTSTLYLISDRPFLEVVASWQS